MTECKCKNYGPQIVLNQYSADTQFENKPELLLWVNRMDRVSEVYVDGVFEHTNILYDNDCICVAETIQLIFSHITTEMSKKRSIAQ